MFNNLLYSTHVQYGYGIREVGSKGPVLSVVHPHDIKIAHNALIIAIATYCFLTVGLILMIVLKTSNYQMAIPLFVLCTVALAVVYIIGIRNRKHHSFQLSQDGGGGIEWFNSDGKLIQTFNNGKLVCLDFNHPRFSSGIEECGLAVFFDNQKWVMLAIGDHIFVQDLEAKALSTGLFESTSGSVALKSNLAGMIQMKECRMDGV